MIAPHRLIKVIRAPVRFRVSSPNEENGFVGLLVRFVADPARNSFTGLRPLWGWNHPLGPTGTARRTENERWLPRCLYHTAISRGSCRSSMPVHCSRCAARRCPSRRVVVRHRIVVPNAGVLVVSQYLPCRPSRVQTARSRHRSWDTVTALSLHSKRVQKDGTDAPPNPLRDCYRHRLFACDDVMRATAMLSAPGARRVRYRRGRGDGDGRVPPSSVSGSFRERDEPGAPATAPFEYICHRAFRV